MIWSRIRQLSPSQLCRLALAFAKRPFLIGPTLNATRKTMKICDQLYGRAHHKNGKENAFRHALWNMLICRNTLKRTKNEQISAFWAEKITILYEKVTKNELFDQFMDLHNNELGRRWFLDVSFENEENLIDFLRKELKNAQKVTKVEKTGLIENQLIYISE